MNVMIAVDQLCNALLGGDPDETISSHAAKHHPRIARFIDRIFFWQPNHCEESIEQDEGKDAAVK